MWWTKKKKLPTIDELWERSRVYAMDECFLQNFENEDDITISRIRYMHGYEQAIKDFVDKKYDPEIK